MPQIVSNSTEERVLFIKAVVLCVVLAFIDQITKYLITQNIEFGKKITVIPGFFDLTYITNPGAAWGIFAHKGIMLLAISLTVVALMFVFFRKLCDGWAERYYALFLIVSGVLGNSWDRLFNKPSYADICSGEVIDFLSFHIGDIAWAVWPSFNVADSCICIGVGFFIISNFVRPDKKDDKQKKSA